MIYLATTEHFKEAKFNYYFDDCVISSHSFHDVGCFNFGVCEKSLLEVNAVIFVKTRINIADHKSVLVLLNRIFPILKPTPLFNF